MGTRRACLAALAGVLWLLGFDVVPMAHVVFHDALDAHEHGHTHEHHSHASEQSSEEKQQPPGDHGDGSVAHRDLAAQAPPISIPRVLEALLAAGDHALPSYHEEAADGRPRTTRARAPPTMTA